MTAGPRRFDLVVADDEAGARLDRLCADRLASEGVSRTTVQRACDEGTVTVNDRVARASTRVRAGDRVGIAVPPPEAPTAAPEDIPLRIAYEDDALLVIDKPAGLVVHPSRGHASGTLVNAVLHHAAVERDDETGPLRPGIVHRLDKGTSGLLVVAKTARAREGLKIQFQKHTIERSYIALTEGTPARQTFDTLHGRHAADRRRFSGNVSQGRRAVTHVEPLEFFADGAAARVRCTLETGRTHQIRVHLAEAGYPVLGDPLYGRRPRLLGVRAVADRLERQALHAAVLGFVHPIDARAMRFEAPLPDDLAHALEALRALAVRPGH